MPLAAAYNTKVSAVLRSLSTATDTPTFSTVVAVSHASSFLFHYSQLLSAALQAASDEVPVATLLKVLEPFDQIKLLMPLLKRAYKCAQNSPHPVGSQEFKNEAIHFYSILCNMFVILTNTAKTMLLSPTVITKTAAIRSIGVGYANEDTVWSWMDKCTHYLARFDARGCLSAIHAEPYIRFAAATRIILYLNPMSVKKRKMEVFYKKDYDVCFVKAFEYFAEDGGNNIVFDKKDYDRHAEDINYVLITFIHNPNGEECSIQGANEALKFSGSIEVQERIYTACLKIFNTTLKLQKVLQILKMRLRMKTL